MGVWDKIKKSINPGEDDDNTYDDDEFEDDFSIGGNNYNNVNDMPASGNFNQQNQVYTQNAPNYNYQPPVNNPPPVSSPTTSVTSVTGSDMFEVKVIKPEKFTDGGKIAELLMARKTVIVNFEETNKEIARRLIDFLKGVSYAIGGQLKPVTEKTFIITPNNAMISTEEIRPENNDRRDNIY